ncbi:MAG: C-GCAxxG-C-C family protein [Treponema sp.]|jgi:C_GCAxxG_C_C family probable redox protein|nr:C-GCAxxG-C-C family protein [Treponema sp.]
MDKITEKEARRVFTEEHLNCAQLVFVDAAKRLGWDADAAFRVSAGFGGGMYHGGVCGCVTGALMAIGLKHGAYAPADPEAKEAFIGLAETFQKRFAERQGSLVCRELLGNSYIPHSQYETQAAETGDEDRFGICPSLAAFTCELLEEFLR